MKLPKNYPTPFVSDYHPAEDITNKLNPDDMKLFQEIRGVFQWPIEIGRQDILHDVSLFIFLSCYTSDRTLGTSVQYIWINSHKGKVD